MKYTKYVFFIFLFLFGCNSRCDISQLIPEFKLIKNISDKIQSEKGLILSMYGINNDLPKDYKKKNITANFSVAYRLPKTKNDLISLEQARCFLVFVAESLLYAINHDPEIKERLEVFPFPSDLLKISIYFEDENRVQLANGGISDLYFSKGKIIYERYEIHGYNPYPLGKHFIVHEESYADALEIVKQQGCLDLVK